MNYLFQQILIRPLLNFLILIYNFLPGHDLGVAVILVTLFIRILLYPLFAKALKSQVMFNKIQPEVSQIQKKFKNDRVEQTKALLELYKKYNFNPFSSMLLLFLQIPILLALYRVFLTGLKPESLSSMLYVFVSNPGVLNSNFLRLTDISKPSILFAALAGITQFFQTKYTMPAQTNIDKSSVQSMMTKQMMYLSPFITVIILWRIAAVISLYWIFSSLLSITQQLYYQKKEATVKVASK